MDHQKSKTDVKLVINNKGPYSLFGTVPIYEYFIVNGEDGKSLRYEKGDVNFSQGAVTNLCRCGESKNKPYCDGTHLKIKWDYELTAQNDKFLDHVKVYEGARYTLWDKECLCSVARFCDAGRGVWDMITDPNNKSEEELSLKVSQLCPSGRLVVQDNATGKMLEPNLEPSLGLIEDTPMETSGPIWVMGGITIETEDGTVLERRNRVNLCRCGASKNKPYCDGRHLEINFKDKNF